MVIRSRKTVADRDHKLRVAIYARRSDESGTRDRSLPEQVAACRRWAEERGYEVVQVYEELGSGVTGATRPHFNRMIADAQCAPRPFDVLVVLDLSRFGRADVDETGYYRHTLRMAGVEVAYVLDGDKMTGDVGEIVGSVLQVGVRDQSRKNGYKVAAAHMACIERGVLPGGRRPYGYQLARRPDWERAQRKDTTLIIDEHEAKVVRCMFADYEAGMSPTVIASTLNEAGVPSPGGGKWWRTTVTEILSNPVYSGDLVRNQRRRGNRVKDQAHFYHLGSKPIPASEEPQAIVRRGVLPAIVERDLWDRVKARLDARATTSTGGKPHVLSGLLRCGPCGGPMKTVAGRTTATARRRYYGCTHAKMQKTAEARGDCGRVGVRGDRIEAAVLDVVRAAAAKIDPSTIAAELRALLPQVEAAADPRKLEQRLRQIEQRRDDLLLSEHSSEFVAAGLGRLEEEHARLRAQLDAARTTDQQVVDVDLMAMAAVEAARRLEAPDTDEGREALREVLRLFLRRVEVGPGDRGAPKPVRVEVFTPQAVACIATRQSPWGLMRRRR